ncbi:exopolysaccharide biosynthesis polyprenyl glycosylphosphotransferase [Lachnotalea glycerini]|uniref:Exopolysaccharide biosynthesis polyprenyl glycosylphosphotransferase n=1 Tax=Lachnotalea glycerini TaxID=1763509 RepID=A0A371JG28_9FIRM|nr:exopolysaccharide biosynthesis polyprenyl glycosylphosphotransferase [Lachnotalea glycerini]RDY31678.1 exopolysaccharide biosynthesis polyprenyl glycosylphosphotransferase [Lachnotalea glycerini]
MYNKEQFKRLVIFVEMAALIALEALVFWIVWTNYYNHKIPLPYWRRGHWVVVILYVLLMYLISRIYGGFKIGYLRLSDVIYSQILSMIIVNFITYLQICLIGRSIMNINPILYVVTIDTGIICVWSAISRYLYISLYPPHKMIMIYGNRDTTALINKMSSRKDKYDIKESVHISEGEDIILEKILGYEAVIISDVPAQIRNNILKYCFKYSIRVYVTPKLSDIIILGSDNIHLFDSPLLLSRNSGLNMEQAFAKRLLDLVLSLILLVIASPFMLIIALLVKLYDGGPILYKQERLTIGGKKFMIFKFRSMKMDSEKHGARLAMKNDDRVTPVGRILRNIHFDELPQIFNIIKGDMSLVGPRPERPVIAKQYEEDIPEFSFRLKVKAGLTGYAQVYGKYNTTPYDKLKLDLMYVENYSVWLDLKLMLMTFKILFQKENTEGVERWQKTASKTEGKKTPQSSKK